ncbi:MAG: DUF3574 domain-containing protein [Alphaproteobacteria bacterium]|nr:DUF3574 domain-containing protein [Alphaproteobacteria bacterium]
MRLAALLLAAFALAGCAGLGREAACPAGQHAVRTAQLFFGQRQEGKPWVPEPAFRRFVDEELVTRFPDGVTVLDGGPRWKDDADPQIRQAAKVALIVLPEGPEAQTRLAAVRRAYKARFDQESRMRMTAPACTPL